jgi:hypothetical protein
MFDYLMWRGDLDFSRDAFNEVDNLIFSAISYIDFADVVPGERNDAKVTLQTAARLLKEADRLKNISPLLRHYPAILERAAESVRFRDVVLSRYVNEVDAGTPNQFSAIVFSMGERSHYIAFRGTDDNLAGWKEDFLMGFRDAVPAQTRAALYANIHIPALRGAVILGGHSKGGNLAVYAAAHASARNMRRIAAVYNNDGPGFQNAVIRSEGYRQILSRITTYIPKSSVVGMLLEHGENYRIVSSAARGIMSHDAVTWEVAGNAFVHEKELTKTSRKLNEALRTWLATLSLEQRAQFVEALFDILEASGAETLTDLSKDRLVGIDAMIRKLKTMDRSSRKLLKDTVMTFLGIRQRILRESIGESLEALVARKA